jgi:hypothetical protein
MIVTKTTEWLQWRSIAAANVRRYEVEHDENWHSEALRIARGFLALFDRESVSRADLAPLLTDAGRLPARDTGATSIRNALIRSYLSVDGTDFEPPPVGAGQLIIDPYGEMCLVTESDSPPPAKWLAQQEFERTQSLGPASWWRAYTLKLGGVALVAEPLVFSVGRPRDDQLWDLMEYLSVGQVKKVVTLFPELAEDVRRER